MEAPPECRIPKFCEEFSKMPINFESSTSEQQIALLSLSLRIDSVTRRWVYYCAGASSEVCPIKPWMFDLLTGNSRTVLQPNIDPR